MERLYRRGFYLYVYGVIGCVHVVEAIKSPRGIVLRCYVPSVNQSKAMGSRLTVIDCPVLWQINHFPGTFRIGRKDAIWRAVSQMQVQRC